MGLVSIITPSFNAEKFVSLAINSVLNQTYSNWELLIVDDCSTDNTVSLVCRYVEFDSRIKLFSLSKNSGAASARNIALDHARGQYIAFLDSDDMWEIDKLQKQLAFMKNKGYAFTFSNYYVMYESGEKTGNIISAPNSLGYNQYLCNTIIGCLTVVIDRKETGDFRMPLIKSSHDMALWLLIMKRGFRAYGINETLASYRLVASSNTSKKWKAARDVWRVYREIESLPLFYSVYCFCGYVLHALNKRL